MPGIRRTIWLLLVLVLTACGGGGGGGGNKNSSSGSNSGTPAVQPIPEGDLDISGTITVAAALAVDMDTRDPRSPEKGLPSNDLPFDLPLQDPPTFNQFEAQLIPSPGTVGGHLSFDGFIGNIPQGDLHDFYRVSLTEGQVISMQIADYRNDSPASRDFDLLLLDMDGAIIDFAAGLGPIETIEAPPGTDEYLVLVTICADLVFISPPGICGNGRSNYTLTVGEPQSLPIAGSLRLSGEFMLNEALVQYVDEPEAGDDDFTASASAVRVTKEKVGDVHRISLSPDVLTATSSALSADEESGGNETASGFVSFSPEQHEKLITLAAIKSLHKEENVAWAEPNYLREALFVPDDPGYRFQWHYPLINLPAAWELGATGTDVTVAVLDTGILPFHPDIEGQIDLVTGGYDFVSSTNLSLDGDGEDPNPEDPGDGNFFGFTSSFHGTHVAGTIAAATNNGVGVAGVAFNANILPVRVLGRGTGTGFDIARGLCFAAGLTTGNCEGVPENTNPADIINLSLGGADASLLEQELIDEITDAGILVVAAAGNNSSSQPFYPASYDRVFGVSAVDLEARLAPYSNFGPSIDLAAPGGNSSQDANGDGYRDGVLSTGGDDSGVTVEYAYPFFQGTSMAAPHVAGVFALMRSVNSLLETDDVDQLLRNGELTVALGDQVLGESDTEFGYGMIDAAKAVSAALSLGNNPPVPEPWLAAVPNNINFGATLDRVQFTLRNNSSGPLDIISIVADQPWLVAPTPDGLGTYELQVNRDGLPEGSYEGVLTITSTSNTVEIRVIMQVNNDLLSGDAGHLYVRLVDPETGNIREVETDVVDGSYSWQISNLPPGIYKLVAFTDADNDRDVCDAGEACGSYLTIDQPVLIDLQSDLNQLDFPLSFGVQLELTPPTPK